VSKRTTAAEGPEGSGAVEAQALVRAAMRVRTTIVQVV
jgi:hypothetical protein